MVKVVSLNKHIGLIVPEASRSGDGGNKAFYVMALKELSPRQLAMEHIKNDYAKHGKDSGVATQYFLEHKISYKKYTELANAGLAMFNAKVNACL